MGKRVSQRIVQHIGVAFDEKELAELVRIGEQFIIEFEEKIKAADGQTTLFSEEDIPSEKTGEAPYETELSEDSAVKAVHLLNEETVIEGPMEVVERLFNHMGLARIFSNASRDYGKRTLLKQVLGGMLCAPSSKRAMAEWLSDSCGSAVKLDRLYRLVEAMGEREERVKHVVRGESEGLFTETPTLMLFDVTTLYFESFKEDALRQCGYSKDNKYKETQVVLALAATPQGLPLWYELFPGKTSEGATLDSFVKTWRKEEYPESSGVVVADRAMGAARNMEHLKEQGLDYVLGAKLKSMNHTLKSDILARQDYTELEYGAHTVLYKIIRLEDSNLLVTWDEKRAKKDRSDREKLVVRAKKKLNTAGRAGAKQLTGNRGTMRYLRETGKSVYVLDEEKIAAESRWDGLHGLKTSLPLETEEEIRAALSHYASLWRIEESFRIKKHELKIRPIYHWTEKRIRGHIALSYLVFACLRQLELRVELQQKERMSPEKLRKTILGITSTIMRDKTTGKSYRFPKQLSGAAKKIYRSLGIKHSTSVKEILSKEKYRNRIRYLDSES